MWRSEVPKVRLHARFGFHFSLLARCVRGFPDSQAGNALQQHVPAEKGKGPGTLQRFWEDIKTRKDAFQKILKQVENVLKLYVFKDHVKTLNFKRFSERINTR